MVTAKKISPAKTATAAPAKAVAAKKPVTKKLANAIPATVTTAPSSPKPEAKAKTKPKAPAKSKAVKSTARLSEDQRNNYVQVAAFYIAERRGFTPGNPAEDWAAAEVEIDRLIASGQFAH
jgi:hypothetical protein